MRSYDREQYSVQWFDLHLFRHHLFLEGQIPLSPVVFRQIPMCFGWLFVLNLQFMFWSTLFIQQRTAFMFCFAEEKKDACPLNIVWLDIDLPPYFSSPEQTSPTTSSLCLSFQSFRMRNFCPIQQNFCQTTKLGFRRRSYYSSYDIRHPFMIVGNSRCWLIFTVGVKSRSVYILTMKNRNGLDPNLTNIDIGNVANRLSVAKN